MTAPGPQQAAAVALIKQRRDQLDQKIGTPSASPAMITNVILLNNSIYEPQHNADLYLSLPKDSPLREKIFPIVFLQLVQEKHYAEAVENDLETLVNDLYARHAHSEHTAATNQPVVSQPRAESVNKIVDWTAAATEALLATNQPQPAKRLVWRALDAINAPESRLRFAEAASRASAAQSAELIKWMDQQCPPLQKTAETK